MNESGGLESFPAHAREQQRRVERLLACRRRLVLLPNGRCSAAAQVRWTADIADPEFMKNLRIFHRLIAEAVRLCSVDGTALETRLEDLKHLVTLPTDVPLTLKLLLAQRFELERLLIEIGDETYLRNRAADFYSEGEGTVVTWEGFIRRGNFPTGPPPLLADLGPQSESAPAGAGETTRAETRNDSRDGSRAERSHSEPIDNTRRMLAWLIAAKEAEDLPLRARRELKQQALLVVLPVIIVTSALFALAISLVKEGRWEVLLPAAAGAVGAALGGLFRLRDEVNFGAQIREFVPFFVGEVGVGAAAGMLVFAVVEAGIVRLGGGIRGLAAFGFVVGFSEAAFLGLVRRVGETLGGTGKPKPRGPEDSSESRRDSTA